MAGQALDVERVTRRSRAGARFLGGSSVPSLQVKGRLLDGIVWVAVGVSLMAQAGFLLAMVWWTPDASVPSDGIPPSIASAVVATAFIVLGAGALGIGVRRLATARRTR